MSVPQFSENQLREIAGVLGDTNVGFSGSAIASLLGEAGLPDPGPITKRHRLHQGMSAGQARDGSGLQVARLLELALDPVRYHSDPRGLAERRDALNVVLAFAGLQVRDDGRLMVTPKASTLSDAQRRASRLRSELVRRGIAGDVLAYCRPELLDGNYFHATFEATKSLAAKIRRVTGLASDGGRLVDEALSIRDGRLPRLAWNRLVTENDRSEHLGIARMISGVFSYFRNLPAHVPKAEAPFVTEEAALEILTILSFLHRKLDQAVSTSPRVAD